MFLLHPGIEMNVFFMRQSVSDISCLHDFHLTQGVLFHQNRHYSPIGRTSPLNQDKSPISIQVVSQIPQTYSGPGPYKADAAHDHVACPLYLDSEDMFNPGADLRSRPVSLQFPFRQFVVARAFALQMFTISHLMHLRDSFLRSVCRIRPHLTTGIVRIKQFVKHVAVVHFGAGYMKTPDQFVLHIHRNMVLVAEKTLAVLLGPASFRVFLTLFILAPSFRLLTDLDLTILLSAIALHWNPDNAGINNLPFLRPKPLLEEKLIKQGKQSANHIRLGQVLPESPKSGSVWHLAGCMKSKETGKGVAVKNLKLHGFIGQIVQRLQDERLKQQDNIKALGPGRRLSFLFSGLFKHGPEYFPINGLVNLRQRIACLVDTLKANRKVEKSKLYHVGLHESVWA